MKKTGLILSVLICMAVCLSSFTAFASASAAKSTTFYDYSSGLTSTSVANTKVTVDGVSINNQGVLELREGADGGKYVAFSSNYEGQNPGHAFVTVGFPAINFADSPRTTEVESVNAKYILLEMDFTTETAYIGGFTMHFQARNHTASADNPAGNRAFIQILKDENGYYLKTDHAKTYLPEERGVWQRISVIAEIPQTNQASAAKDIRACIYLNGQLIDSGIQIITSDANYLAQWRINMPLNAEVSKNESFCFDNFLVKTFGDNAEIATLLSEGKGLDGFSESAWTEDYDFPSVRALFDVDGVKYGSVPELRAALNGGETVTVLRDVPDTVDFTTALTLKNPNGYNINYTTEGLTEVKDGTTTHFYGEFSALTVKWHIGDGVIEETYTSLAKATFKGTYPASKVVDGVTYCAVGFAKSENGEVLSDLGYVSESNNEFWLVYSAPLASVTHSDGTVDYAYSTAEVESFVKNSAIGDYILLNADATLSSYSFSAKKVFTLDLGGHTLTQATDASNHMLILLGSESSVTVKNGTVTPVKNIVFIQQDCNGINVTLEDLTINTKMTVADVRSGSLTVKGCTVGFSGHIVTAFAGTDNNNGPTVIFENSTVTGGTTLVNTATKDAATRIYSKVIVKNSSIATSTVVGAGYCNLIEVEGGVIECGSFVACGLYDLSVGFTGGTVLKCGSLSSTSGGAVTITAGEGEAFARNNDGYVVTDEYATITWIVGTQYSSEAWVKGVTPVCPFEIPEANATVKYTFDEITPAHEDKQYALLTVPAFTPMMNISLSLDFDLGIYLPAEADIVSINIAGITHTYEQPIYVNVGGIAYKKYTFYGITPEHACDRILLELVLSGGDFTVEADYEISLVGYLNTILSGGYSQEAEMLAAAVADYIDKAYIYAGRQSDVAYAELLALAETYNLEMAVRNPVGEVYDMSAVSGAVSSARFVLDSDLTVRFELNSGYTGRLRIGYYREGELCRTEINIVNGRYQGREYIDLTIDAADLCREISFAISDGKGGYLEGGYSLYTYVDAMKGKDARLDALLRSLYSYSVAADAYKATKA
ncbi:MAG: hypothetical protein IKV43_05250 [Clostridia bacterium]|nr:hypothetical protein [Clostridia bacterium]